MPKIKLVTMQKIDGPSRMVITVEYLLSPHQAPGLYKECEKCVGYPPRNVET